MTGSTGFFLTGNIGALLTISGHGVMTYGAFKKGLVFMVRKECGFPGSGGFQDYGSRSGVLGKGYPGTNHGKTKHQGTNHGNS